MLPTRAASGFHAAVRELKVARLERAAKKVEDLLAIHRRVKEPSYLHMPEHNVNTAQVAKKPLHQPQLGRKVYRDLGI